VESFWNRGTSHCTRDSVKDTPAHHSAMLSDIVMTKEVLDTACDKG
ncbi:hypothetical protein BACINT_00914, partial [Bacteroides intestinalis DSM 17393]